MIQLILSLSHLTWRMRKPWPNSTFLFNAYRMCFHLLSLELALANFKVMKILVRVLQHALAKLNPVRHDSLIIKWSFSIHVHWLGPQSIAAIFSTVIHGTSTAVFCLFKHFFFRVWSVGRLNQRNTAIRVDLLFAWRQVLTSWPIFYQHIYTYLVKIYVPRKCNPETSNRVFLFAVWMKKS